MRRCRVRVCVCVVVWAAVGRQRRVTMPALRGAGAETFGVGNLEGEV
jgi:hypothetical protein